ncbi:hypothetical protein GCM10027047_31400 [Rhodococcus aerolatus]
MSPPPEAGHPEDRRRRQGPQQRSTPRSELQRNPRFAEVSPEVGELDEDAFDALLGDDPDAALAMLADMGRATDERLRALARRLAARIALDRTRTSVPRARGVSRMRTVRADRGGDLDLDGSMDAVVAARAAGVAPDLEDLRARQWGRPELAVCLLVDRSGSMGGARLAAAALTAAACAWRAPGEHAVLAFSREVEVLRPMVSQRPGGEVVDAVLGLRGHGVTALATALGAAATQLAASRAERRVVVLLSDCRATDEVDPVPAAAGLPELVVLAPADDPDAAEALALAAGARWAAVEGASQAPAALAELLG